MAAAATISLLTGTYEPFGAAVAFQRFEPSARTTSGGLLYIGQDTYAGQDEDNHSHKESLVTSNNLNNGSAQKIMLKGVIQMPIIRSVDGVDTVVDVAFSESVFRLPKVMLHGERERLGHLTSRLHLHATVAAAIEDLVVPW